MICTVRSRRRHRSWSSIIPTVAVPRWWFPMSTSPRRWREPAGADRRGRGPQAGAERMRGLAETSTLAMAMLDLDGRVVGWNGGAQRLMGYPAGEGVGRHVGALPALDA